MMKSITVFYIIKAFLLKNCIIFLIIIDLMLILLKFFVQLEKTEYLFILNKILDFYNVIQTKYFYLEFLKNKNKFLDDIRIDNFLILMQKFMKLISIYIPVSIYENSDFYFLLTSYCIKTEIIYLNFFRFWGKLILIKLVKKYFLINLKKKINVQNYKLLDNCIFYLFRKCYKYKNVNKEILFYTNISFISLLLKLKFNSKYTIEKMGADIFRLQTNLIIIKNCIKKNKDSLYFVEKILRNSYFFISNTIKRFVKDKKQFINQYVINILNFYSQTFLEKDIFSEFIIFTYNKLTLIKKKFWKIKNFNLLFRLINFVNYKLLILNNKNLNYNYELFKCQLLKWNFIYILLGYYQINLNNKKLSFFIVNIIILIFIKIFTIKLKLLKKYKNKINLDNFFFLLNSIDVIKPFVFLSVGLSKMIFVYLSNNFSVYGKKKNFILLNKWIYLNIKSILNRAFSNQLSSSDFVSFIMIELEKIQFRNFFFNICKIDILNTKETFGNFYNLFLSNLMISKKICFYQLSRCNPRFISIYIFLLLCNGDIIKKNLNCRIMFLFHIKNLQYFKYKTTLKKKNILFNQRNFLVNFTRVMLIIIIKIQSIYIKINLVILIGQYILETLFYSIFNFKTRYEITSFFFYVILKILLNFHTLEYCSFNTNSCFYFLNSEKVDYKKIFIIFRLINLIIQSYKKIKSNLISEHINTIFSFFFKYRLPVMFFKKKIFLRIGFFFIHIQNNGNDYNTHFPKLLYNKYINMILYLNVLLIKEKNKLFLTNKIIKIQPVDVYKMIKMIKNNISSNSCAFKLFKIKEMIFYTTKNFNVRSLVVKKKKFSKFFS
jgi:hypothetical protein